jgi:hypothetical protein
MTIPEAWTPSMHHKLAALFALSFLTIAGPSHAQSSPAGFQSPSKNIACQYFDYDRQNILRCDIAATETKPRRPADCELDYGGAFEMNARGPAARSATATP